MAGGVRWKTTFNQNQMKKAINNAAEATAYSMAFDLKEYMVERFEEPKSGHDYFLENNTNRWWVLGHQPDDVDGTVYTASAPGEYPAIKYGILNDGLKYRRVQKDENGVVLEFGVGRQFGSRRGMRNDPFYALDVDQGHTNAPRPYFARAMTETSSARAASAPKVFIGHWNRLSALIGSGGGIPDGSGDQSPDSPQGP